MTPGLLRFSELYEQVQADRLKNGEMVEGDYLKHCTATKMNAKKVTKIRIVM